VSWPKGDRPFSPAGANLIASRPHHTRPKRPRIRRNGGQASKRDRPRRLKRCHAGGVPVLRSCETAVTSCAGANGFANMMLFRDPLRRPIASISAAHVNDGKGRVDFSGMSGDVPAVDLVAPKIDVGDKRSIFSFGCVEQLQSIFAGRSYYHLKSTVGKAFFDDALNKLVVLNDQDNR
jgi:hypothetical protein